MFTSYKVIFVLNLQKRNLFAHPCAEICYGYFPYKKNEKRQIFSAGERLYFTYFCKKL